MKRISSATRQDNYNLFEQEKLWKILQFDSNQIENLVLVRVVQGKSIDSHENRWFFSDFVNPDEVLWNNSFFRDENWKLFSKEVPVSSAKLSIEVQNKIPSFAEIWGISSEKWREPHRKRLCK